MYFTNGSSCAFEMLMRGKPGFDRYENGGCADCEDCNTCHFYRPHWKYTYRVLTDYFHLLRRWETQYAPQTPDDEWHPLFVEALQKTSYIEYLLDTLIDGSLEERQALVAEQRNEVMKLEQRFAERRTETRHSRSQRKSGLDR